MKMRRNWGVVFLFFLAFPLFAKDFTATAVMSAPGRADISSRIYVADGKIRKEFFYYGEPVIQILDSHNSISLMCFSEQMVCYENTLVETIENGLYVEDANPCAGKEGVTCVRESEVTLNKRKTFKWKLTTKQGEEEIHNFVWMDAELNIPVKNLIDGSTSLELVWMGDELVNDRQTQHWMEIKYTPAQLPVKRKQWFDKELKISIKDLYPNGSIQELKHIVISKLDPKLFEVPIGFEKKVVEK